MDDKRDRILAAARKRFRHYGFKKTAVLEVARDAGVAVGTVYRYFKDKDDLLLACIDAFVARHRRQAEEALAGASPAGAKLRRYLLARFRAAEETRTGSGRAAELAREVLRLRPGRLQEDAGMMEGAIARLLRQGVAAGEFVCDDPERDARVLLFAVAVFFPTALTAPPYAPHEEDLLLVVDWFLTAWRRGAAGQRGR
jgi:AcrR family transcriptional regulator